MKALYGTNREIHNVSYAQLLGWEQVGQFHCDCQTRCHKLRFKAFKAPTKKISVAGHELATRQPASYAPSLQAHCKAQQPRPQQDAARAVRPPHARAGAQMAAGLSEYSPGRLADALQAS